MPGSGSGSDAVPPLPSQPAPPAAGSAPCYGESPRRDSEPPQDVQVTRDATTRLTVTWSAAMAAVEGISEFRIWTEVDGLWSAEFQPVRVADPWQWQVDGTPGHGYAFRVTAINQAGESPASPSSEPVAIPVPDPPAPSGRQRRNPPCSNRPIRAGAGYLPRPFGLVGKPGANPRCDDGCRPPAAAEPSTTEPSPTAPGPKSPPPRRPPQPSNLPDSPAPARQLPRAPSRRPRRRLHSGLRQSEHPGGSHHVAPSRQASATAATPTRPAGSPPPASPNRCRYPELRPGSSCSATSTVLGTPTAVSPSAGTTSSGTPSPRREPAR